MLRRHSNITTRRRRKRGFTLIECIVSIAIFAIMGTMFATFMISSVRVVNLSIANDRDREALIEAIAAARAGTYETIDGMNTVTVQLLPETGDMLTLEIDLECLKKADLDEEKLDNTKYLTFTTKEGTRYCVYLGNTIIKKPDEGTSGEGASGEGAGGEGAGGTTGG